MFFVVLRFLLAHISLFYLFFKMQYCIAISVEHSSKCSTTLQFDTGLFTVIPH
jgi:hypothetical protein